MVKARKRFGQHFLESAWVTKLVKALNAQPEDAFVEIGPGRGAITRPLAAQVARLLAIEVDRDLAAELVAEQLPTLTVVQGDVLETELGEAVRGLAGAPAGRGASGPRRRQPPLQHLVADHVHAAEAGGHDRRPDRRHADAAARGGRPADRQARHQGVRGAVDPHRPARRRHADPGPAAGRLPAAAAGLVRRGPAGVPAAAGHAGRTRRSSRGWSGRCSPSAARR